MRHHQDTTELQTAENELMTIQEKMIELNKLKITNEQTLLIQTEESNALKNHIQSSQTTLHDLQTTIDANDKLTSYGKHMKNVLKNIKSTQWNGIEPIGPIGLYCSLILIKCVLKNQSILGF